MGFDRTIFCDLLRREQIDVARIMAERFEAKLTAAKVFPVGQPSDADFSFEVKMVGAGIQGPFSTGMRPVMTIEAKLTNRAGKVIWLRPEDVTMVNSPATAAGLPEWTANPTLLREGFAKVADKLADDLLRDLAKS